MTQDAYFLDHKCSLPHINTYTIICIHETINISPSSTLQVHLFLLYPMVNCKTAFFLHILHIGQK